MTNYANGTRFERVVAARLTDDGYLCVRAAGSKGVADLIAVKVGQVLLISCKLGGPSAISREEWNSFLKAGDDHGALCVVAWRPARGKVGLHLITGYRAVSSRVLTCCQEWTPDEVMASG